MAPKSKSKAQPAFADSENNCDKEALKLIFQKIDLDHNGSLDLEELEAAARELGVRCSRNSMRKVFKMIDVGGSGVIDFEQFFTFFGQASDPQKMRNLLSSANQAFLDYRMRVETDPDFAKTFPFPASLEPTQRFENINSDVECVLWAPENQIAAVTADGQVLLWDAHSRGKNLKPKSRSPLGSSGVYCAEGVFPTGSQKLLVGFGRKTENVCLWDMQVSALDFKISVADSAVYCAAVGGGTALAGCKSGSLTSIDLSRGEAVRTLTPHENVVNSCAFSEHNGNSICTASRDGMVHMIDLREGAISATLEDAAAGYAVTKAVYLSSHELLTAGEDFCLKRWDLRNPQTPLLAYLGHTQGIRTVALSANKKLFVTGCFDGSARVWTVDKQVPKAAGPDPRKRLEQLKAERERVVDLLREGDADMAQITAITAEITELEGDIAKGSYLEEVNHAHVSASVDLIGHRMPVKSVAFGSGGKGARILTGCQDESACLFDVDTKSFLA